MGESTLIYCKLNKIKQNKEFIMYAISMAMLLLLLRFLEYKFLILQNEFGLYIGIIALFFTFLGIWASNKLTSPKVKTIVIEKEIVVEKRLDFVVNEEELNNRKISKRELEVLELMAQGLSNQEIASRLFVSLNTIKTHSSNLFQKLEVKRRTQAIETAKKIGIIE
ncbi:helix-turn-helix transcriptional regulator [Flavobacterium aquatile LMG 4008 = ATCC 11947]|nr:helix-turn-helix transcriptional regulator [Flavobacterium aquatile LMG 4008 = ATCC 11947]GEC79911.1 helix-turn-helix transcriptional regulator [Flavobacterium aquatile]